MGLCGPENNIGCLKTLFAKLTDKYRKKKEEKVKYSEGNINPSLSTPSINTVGSQNKLIDSQVPQNVSKVNVNGYNGSLI
jgi:hypothetical protein